MRSETTQDASHSKTSARRIPGLLVPLSFGYGAALLLIYCKAKGVPFPLSLEALPFVILFGATASLVIIFETLFVVAMPAFVDPGLLAGRNTWAKYKARYAWAYAGPILAPTVVIVLLYAGASSSLWSFVLLLGLIWPAIWVLAYVMQAKRGGGKPIDGVLHVLTALISGVWLTMWQVSAVLMLNYWNPDAPLCAHIGACVGTATIAIYIHYKVIGPGRAISAEVVKSVGIVTGVVGLAVPLVFPKVGIAIISMTLQMLSSGGDIQVRLELDKACSERVSIELLDDTLLCKTHRLAVILEIGGTIWVRPATAVRDHAGKIYQISSDSVRRREYLAPARRESRVDAEGGKS